MDLLREPIRAEELLNCVAESARATRDVENIISRLGEALALEHVPGHTAGQTVPLAILRRIVSGQRVMQVEVGVHRAQLVELCLDEDVVLRFVREEEVDLETVLGVGGGSGDRIHRRDSRAARKKSDLLL